MKVANSQQAFDFFKSRLTAPVEEFWALALNSNKAVIATQCLFRGTVDCCLTHPRDVFRFACLSNASSIIVAHNHPSGDLLPSHSDLEFTRRLVSCGRLFQIKLDDHLIISRLGYTSLCDLGLLKSGLQNLKNLALK